MAKRGFLRRLERDLRRADGRVIVEMSTSSDPYPPEEERLRLTRRALKLLLERGFKVIILTKSDMVLRDLDVVAGKPVTVSLTITTLDESLARVLEPGAPPPSRRLECAEQLAESGVPVSVRVDPVIPHLNDDPVMLRELVDAVVEAGARHIVTSAYKARPDSLARLSREFPDLASKWRLLYYEEGVRVGGYRYLRLSVRRRLLAPVVSEAAGLGVTYATCREGLSRDKTFFNAPTCDGSHLAWLAKRSSPPGSR